MPPEDFTFSEFPPPPPPDRGTARHCSRKPHTARTAIRELPAYSSPRSPGRDLTPSTFSTALTSFSMANGLRI